nr:RNA-directed DNA polymerase, eukaryota [Tanacetum cinerariifolium]
MGIDEWQDVSRKKRSNKTKEDDLIKISISVYVTNFPESSSAKDLFHACSKFGHVVDSFIPVKRSWVKERKVEQFGNMNTIVQELGDIDKSLDSGIADDHLLFKRVELSQKLHEIDTMASQDAKQKSKIKWAIEGDENSNFFHGIINKKRSQLAIRGVFDNGKWCSDPVELDNIKRKMCIVSAYEETTRLMVNDPVLWTHKVLRSSWNQLRRQSHIVPLVLWKPYPSIYPELINNVADGLTFEETKEMRNRGLNSPLLIQLRYVPYNDPNRDCLPTRFNLSRKEVVLDSVLCPLCDAAVETTQHVFFQCPIVRSVFYRICRWWDLEGQDLESFADWQDWFLSIRMLAGTKNLLDGVFATFWWAGVERDSYTGKLRNRKMVIT